MMMKIKQTILGAAMMLAVVTLVSAEEWSISWHTTDGGGVQRSTAGPFTLSGTIGQADAGPGASGMTGGPLTIVGGFWAMSVGSCGDDGDFDGDGDVDLVDFGEFQLCFTGPGVSLDPGCECGDFDGDNDLDLADFGSFQLTFTGSL
jgi:hypothetical protein